MVPERTYTFNLEGDLGAFDAPRIEALFPPPSDYTRVVVDCTDVTSIDSSVIASIMRYRQSFALAGHDPLNIVVIASSRMRTILDLTGVARFLTVLYP